MSLRFHNQLTKTVEEFTTMTPGVVNMYSCGPTVYDYPHVGNWTAYIYWDTLRRVLEANNLKVHHVINITDVGHLVSDADEGEDKLEKSAKKTGKTAWEVSKFYTDDFIAGLAKLNIKTPTHLPRATDYIPQQIDLVRRLKKIGATYQISDGIYYDTSTFPAYADFANLDLGALKAGARVELNPEKRNISDFALWKFTPSGEKRDMEWETPADITDDGVSRMGFPGWHIECSAMAIGLLGETLDIHTGGIDHIPIHHTNEIAQSEKASGKQFSRFWLHSNHLKSNGTKISKSLNNGYTLQDIEEEGFSPLDFRMLVLQGHYKNEGNFTFENLNSAKQRRLNWRNVAALRHQIHDTITADEDREEESKTVQLYSTIQYLTECLSNDLDTPGALTTIDEVFSEMSRHKLQDIHHHAFGELLGQIDRLLGLDLLGTSPDINDEQKQLIIARTRARENKDFAESDRIRDLLKEQGINLRDNNSEVIWEYI